MAAERAFVLAAMALITSVALAGCSDAPEPAPPTPTTRDLYVGGGAFVLDDNATAETVSVTVPGNATALRMELTINAASSRNPRVHGIPDCDWRTATTLTDTYDDVVDCARVVRGVHLLHVEHDGGHLSMGVRVMATVPG